MIYDDSTLAKDYPFHKGYQTAKIVSLKTLFAFLDSQKTEIHGHEVSKGKTLYVVKNNQVCAVCGIKASYAAIEKNNESAKGSKGWHINVWAVRDDEKHVLLTKDHIIPKSKGGNDDFGNLQTMCVTCNSRKGNGDSNKNHNQNQQIVWDTTAPTKSGLFWFYGKRSTACKAKLEIIKVINDKKSCYYYIDGNSVDISKFTGGWRKLNEPNTKTCPKL